MRKYARTNVRGDYLFREVNSFLRATLRRTGYVQGQLSEHIFKVKWSWRSLGLSFLIEYLPQNAGSENWEISFGYFPVLASVHLVA